MAKHPDETQWEEKTPPDSLLAMRKAIEANTATSNAALEWSIKTYQLIEPVVKRMSILERRVDKIEQHGFRWPLLLAAMACAASLVGVACELVK